MQACVRGGGVCAGGPFCCTKSAKYTSLCVRAHCVCVTHARVRMLSRARALSLCACVHACTEREGNTRMDEYSQNYTTRTCIRRVFLCACKGFLCIRACVCVRLRAFAYSLPGRERTHKHTHKRVFIRSCLRVGVLARSKHKFSKVLCTVPVYGTCARAQTSENVCPDTHSEKCSP